MSAYDPYGEGYYQSAAQVAKSAHDLYVQPVSMAAQGGSMTQSGTAGMTSGSMMQGGMTSGSTMQGGMTSGGMMQGGMTSGGMMQSCMKGISTPNMLRGRVKNLTPGAVNTIVVVELSDGQTITTSIPMGAIENMGLRVGSAVMVIINQNDVILMD